jgi:hypothetical protein
MQRKIMSDQSGLPSRFLPLASPSSSIWTYRRS